MLASFLIAFLCLTTVQHASLQNSENIANQIIEYYIDATGLIQVDCRADIDNPCRQIDDVFSWLNTSNQYFIHVFEGQYDHSLSVYDYFKLVQYPTVDIVAQGDAQINIIGSVYPIGQVTISFTKFSIDFGDLYFLIDDDKSSLKFSNCNIFRNAGNTAINSHSLAIINLGSLILEKQNIDGDNLEGNQPLIQATSPQLIQFTSLTVANVVLVSGSTAPLLLSANYDQVISVEPILLIENSEIIQNTLAQISEASTIQLEGLKPQQILIKNSTINNRSPPNNDNQYEFKITLPSGSIQQDLKSQFQQVDLGATFDPVAVKVLPNQQFDYLIMPLSDEYANIQVNNNGQESCSSYVANFHNDVRTLSCAMIIIRAQDSLGLLKGVQRTISISGSFAENDLRTDDLDVQFTGESRILSLNRISFLPNLPVSTNPIDGSLFRVYDDGAVTLTNLIIQRSNQIGSENVPIVTVISRTGKQSNGLQKNTAGQLVIDNCIFEGGNSPSSDVWYNLGLAETCNVGYGAAVVADGQTVVRISGSSIRTFEGPAVRTLNGASVTIDRNTIFDNNGLRNRNTLSSMQTNVVCEGGIGTTTIDIALDNVTSFTSTGNAWIYQQSESSCYIRATFNGEVALSRSFPLTNSANVIVNNTNQQAQVTINGKFLEPCLRSLVLEIHENNNVTKRITQEFGIESSSVKANWIDSQNLIILFPSSLLKDLNTQSTWEVSIYESGKREQALWVTAQPSIIGESKPDIDATLIVSIVVPIVVLIIAIIIIAIILAVCIRRQNRKYKPQTSNTQIVDNIDCVDVRSLKEEENAENQAYQEGKENKQQRLQHPHFETVFISDSDTELEQIGQSDNNNTLGDNQADQRQLHAEQLERQKEFELQDTAQDSQRSKQQSSERSDTNLTEEDQQVLKGEMNKKTQKSRNQSKNFRKTSKQIKGRTDRQKKRIINEKKSQSVKISNTLPSEQQSLDSKSSQSSLRGRTDSESESDSQSSGSYSSYRSDSNGEKQSKSSIETQDVNEPKEIIEQTNKKRQKKQHKSKQNKQDENKKQYSVQDAVKQEDKSIDKTENDSRSVTSAESMYISEDIEGNDKIEAQITAKTKTSPVERRQQSKKTPKSKSSEKIQNKEKKDKKTDKLKKVLNNKPTEDTYQEGESSSQPSPSDTDSTSSSITSSGSSSDSGSAIKYQEQNTSQEKKKNKKKSKLSSKSPKSPQKEKTQSKTKPNFKTNSNKRSHSKSKNLNDKPKEPKIVNQLQDHNTELTSDSLPPPDVLPGFDELQLVIHRDQHGETVENNVNSNNNEEEEITADLSTQSTDMLPPVISGLMVIDERKQSVKYVQ